jgi:MarR family transcriptional regulator, negative regulator of the multidrug operon emrRAB
MDDKRTENIVGALALALADTLLDGAAGEAPEPGHAAAAIALLRHEPGMPIERLRRALSLSHPGAVRLADRLAASGLVERRPAAHDRRSVALHLTPEGEHSCTRILATRHDRLARALAVLSPGERATLARLTEKLLASFVEDERQAYAVCRLCDTAACADCPVETALDAMT